SGRSLRLFHTFALECAGESLRSARRLFFDVGALAEAEEYLSDALRWRVACEHDLRRRALQAVHSN
ncbi:MAG TPA: hypothetical protein VKN63_08985, partial [Afifellaceae bacterium]|nr:hypothetical protein [Afifellaceae bacterium]